MAEEAPKHPSGTSAGNPASDEPENQTRVSDAPPTQYPYVAEPVQPYYQYYPVYSPPYPYYPQYQYYPSYPPMMSEPRKDSVLPAVIAVLVVFVVIMAVPALLLVASLSSWENEEWSEAVFDDELSLAPGGNFKVWASWGSTSSLDIFLNVTDGSAVDVYVMTEDQYSSTYAGDEPLAFSAVQSWESVTELSEACDVTDRMETLYIVVDNVDNPLRPDDAAPDGNVEIELKVIATYVAIMD